ncbi:MAG: methionyl-tRNA formyltransferase, partial [Kiritimatiellae bacterium]|nr:methionyl-tRNA formyltransferase [Kiritimatiellia bacterium]
VLTDKKSLNIIEFCTKEKMPIFIGCPRGGNAKDFISDFQIDVLLSINYLFLIEADIYNYPKQYAINFHGSLLPKYRGRTPHVWAIINGEKQTGITAHIITKGCDAGDIVFQKVIRINENDTGADILTKYEKQYPIIVNKVLENMKNNKLKGMPQDLSKGSFFGKRTPEDGKIDWNWQKERIKNWVRAQAFPYPGAFSLINDKRIIINKIFYSDSYFHSNQKNGEILNVSPLEVKTPNGVVLIEEYVEDIDLAVGDIFE